MKTYNQRILRNSGDVPDTVPTSNLPPLSFPQKLARRSSDRLPCRPRRAVRSFSSKTSRLAQPSTVLLQGVVPGAFRSFRVGLRSKGVRRAQRNAPCLRNGFRGKL